MLRILIGLAASLLLASSVCAKQTLLEHTQAVSQTMSALYMKGLSEGNNKFQRDLDHYHQLANSTLQTYVSEGGENAAALQQQWNTFQNQLAVEYSEEFGWDLDAAIARDFRGYLSTLYAMLAQQPFQTTEQQLAWVATQVHAVTARFFDISSSYNGTVSLSTSDAEKINPKQISAQLKATLDSIAETAKPDIKKRLLSAKSKWEFVEEGVTNYSGQSAYFLVYATNNKIQQMLEQTQESVATGGL